MTIEPNLNILHSTVPIPVHDLKIKLTDFFFVKSLVSVVAKPLIDLNRVWYEWI